MNPPQGIAGLIAVGQKRRPFLTFHLWRQDDNGNRLLVETFADWREAESHLALPARGGHKQTYWLTEQNPETAPYSPSDPRDSWGAS